MLNVAANIWLIPRYELLGAGMASVLSYGSGALLALLFLTRTSPLTWRDVVPTGRELRALQQLVRDRTLPDLSA